MDLAALRRLAPWAIGFSLIVLLAILIWTQVRGGQDLRSSFAALDAKVIGAAIACHMGAHAWWALRLWLLAGGLETRLSMADSWRIITSGLAAAAVTPGRIGGEGWKMGVLLRSRHTPAAAGRLLLADRAADLVFFLTMGVVATVLLPQMFGDNATSVARYTAFGLAMLVVFVALLVMTLAAPARMGAMAQGVVSVGARMVRRDVPDLQGKTTRLVQDVRSGLGELLKGSPARVVAAFVLSAANWITDYGALWFLLRGFGYDVPFLHVILVGVVLTMVASIPVTPGGSGVAELTAIALLTPLAPGLTPAFVVAWRGVTYYYDLTVGSLVATHVWRHPIGPPDEHGAGPTAKAS